MVQNQEVEFITKKVVLLGNTAVGKTSIFSQIINNTFTDDQVSSTAAFHRTKILEIPGQTSTQIKMNLWDTAGQEKFQALTKMYVQDTAGIILVYDLTYPESLEGVITWYKMATEHVNLEDTVIVLVGNKCDMMENIQINNQQALDMSQKIKADLSYEVSAKERINIERMFSDMAMALMKKDRSRSSTSIMINKKQEKKKGCAC